MNNLGTKQLETDRLILKRIKKEYAKEAFQNWTNDENVCKYVTWKSHGKVEVTEKLFTNWEQEYYNDHVYRWVVLLKETNELIGTIDTVNKNIRDKTCEIGYCYGSKYWGNGYATEALKVVIDYLLNQVGFELIEAKHLVNNPASGRVMEKAGMKYEATLRNRMILDEKEGSIDLKIYSIMKTDQI